jgi:hypothetical protein
VTLSFRIKVTQSAHYEANEYSEGLFSLDGRLVGTNGTDRVARLAGDGNAGPARTTGWRLIELDLGTLAPGVHTLRFGGYNNQKTNSDEWTDVLVDTVTLRAR